MSLARPSLNRARTGNKPRGDAARPRTGQFSASPVLGLRLPMWRSKFVVFLMFAAFLALAGRAMWIQGPGNIGLDMNLTKRVKLSETKEFELRIDAVNVLNRPNFGAPVAANLSINSTSFGRITTATGSRSFVLNSRINF